MMKLKASEKEVLEEVVRRYKKGMIKMLSDAQADRRIGKLRNNINRKLAKATGEWR